MWLSLGVWWLMLPAMTVHGIVIAFLFTNCLDICPIVTHNMNQATRVSDRTAFLYMGELVEYDDTMKIFQNPQEERTKAYISGLFS